MIRIEEEQVLWPVWNRFGFEVVFAGELGVIGGGRVWIEVLG